MIGGNHLARYRRHGKNDGSKTNEETFWEVAVVNYEAPNGKKLHNRLWNGGNGKGTMKLYRDGKLIDEVTAENVGCEYGEYDQ